MLFMVLFVFVMSVISACILHCEPKEHTKMFFDIQSTKPYRL